MKTKEAFAVMQAARTALILDEPFWGALALRLALVEDASAPTAWTNGVSLGYNPDFIAGLTFAQTVGLVAHEVAHCALGHPWRRAGREPKQWNVACDHAINPVLVSASFTLPDGTLLEKAYEGRSAEWIYDRLPPHEQGGDEGQGSPQDGDGQDGGDKGTPRDAEGQEQGTAGQEAAPGEVRDAPQDAPDGEADWQQAVQQSAQAAKMRGKLPSALERFAGEAAKPRVEWRSVLRRFVTELAKADYTWKRPNARFMSGGLYLPSLRSEAMGPIAVVVDTSGSIDGVTLDQFAGEINAVVDDVKPERVHVFYADSRVQGHDVFEAGDPVVLKPRGGGGTHFAPALEAIAALDEPVRCAVYLTDLFGGFPATEPEFPVLWATTWSEDAPWGEVVKIA